MGSSCENVDVMVWRGHFEGTSETKSVNLSINGGEGTLIFLLPLPPPSSILMSFVSFTAFAASVFLNSHFLNTSYGKYVAFCFPFIWLESD